MSWRGWLRVLFWTVHAAGRIFFAVLSTEGRVVELCWEHLNPKGPKRPSHGGPPSPGSAAILCIGGLDVIRKEAWPFYRTISGVRLYWVLEEPKVCDHAGRVINKFSSDLGPWCARERVPDGDTALGNPGANRWFL